MINSIQFDYSPKRNRMVLNSNSGIRIVLYFYSFFYLFFLFILTSLHDNGTHCAGTIGAIGGNDKGVNSVLNVGQGVGGFSNFFIGKGLDNNGSGSYSGIIAATEACGDAGAKVISMSLGGSSSSQALIDASKTLFQSGILLVAAAGNGGNSGHLYPASYDWLMSVAAVDASENRAYFSTINNQVEISAPGYYVQSTLPNNGYASWSGTSMACPHVAGVAALVWSHFPDCTPYQIRKALTRSADGNRQCDNLYGWGIVQAKAAYDLLATEGCDGMGGSDVNDGFTGGCAFDEPTPTPSPCTNMNFEIYINTDRFGFETSWTLKKGSERIDTGYGYGNRQAYTIMKCLEPGEYTWIITDDYGDGMCCRYGKGKYELKVYGNIIVQGGSFTSHMSHTFTVEPPPETTPAPISAPTQEPAPTDCPICAPTGEECCGTCVDYGKPSNRGCS